MRITLRAAAAVTLMLIACGRLADPRTPRAGPVPTTVEPGVSTPLINWDNPIDGIPVASEAAAQLLVPFEIKPPGGFGAPLSIIVSPPNEIAAEGRVVAFIYDDPKYGRVTVKEHFPDIPPEQYNAENRSALDLNGQPNVSGTFEIVRIRGGKDALITTSADGSTSSIFWLEGQIEIIIRGPTLDRAACIALAERV